jgi:hypothetical protein
LLVFTALSQTTYTSFVFFLLSFVLPAKRDNGSSYLNFSQPRSQLKAQLPPKRLNNSTNRPTKGTQKAKLARKVTQLKYPILSLNILHNFFYIGITVNREIYSESKKKRHEHIYQNPEFPNYKRGQFYPVNRFDYFHFHYSHPYKIFSGSVKENIIQQKRQTR